MDPHRRDWDELRCRLLAVAVDSDYSWGALVEAVNAKLHGQSIHRTTLMRTLQGAINSKSIGVLVALSKVLGVPLDGQEGVVTEAIAEYGTTTVERVLVAMVNSQDGRLLATAIERLAEMAPRERRLALRVLGIDEEEPDEAPGA